MDQHQVALFIDPHDVGVRRRRYGDRDENAARRRPGVVATVFERESAPRAAHRLVPEEMSRESSGNGPRIAHHLDRHAPGAQEPPWPGTEADEPSGPDELGGGRTERRRDGAGDELRRHGVIGQKKP